VTGDGGAGQIHLALLQGDVDATPQEQERRDLKHEMVEEAAALVERIVLLDAAGGDAAAMRAVVSDLRALSARIDLQPSYRERGGMNRAAGWEAALTERSPISGRSNPLAAPLVVWQEGDRLRGHATYGRRHEGPYDHVHGGVVMGAFDEILGIAQSMSGQAGYTGTLKVVMRAPTPLFRRIDYEAGLDRLEGRKLLMWGRSRVNEKVLCEAEGIFVAPREATRTMGRIASGE